MSLDVLEKGKKILRVEADPAVAENDSDDEFQDDSEDEFQDGSEADEEEAYEEVNPHPIVDFDKDDPPMIVRSTYRNMSEFKLALCQHAIKHEFEFNTEKSSQSRFRAYCSRKVEDNCPWRLHASTTVDKCAVMVKRNIFSHACSITRRKKTTRNATKHWICWKVKDFLIQEPTLGATVLKKKIKEHHKVSIPYHRVYKGQQLALKQLYGDWDSSFNNLFSFKAQVESSCPGSSVIIDHYTVSGKIRFRRFFFAMKPCIDGFLNGCRSYLAINSTFLTGKFNGQLASASAVDGHNWLYPVCVGVFDSETNDNWIWFMSRLREAIGSPLGLAISTDAGQAIIAVVAEVFPKAEHRECMYHLVTNFKKRYRGKVFDEHLWQQLTHGTHTCLRSTGLRWRKKKLLQLII